MFLVSEDRLLELAATRSGRISYAGFNYQCAYAIARLASMITTRGLFGLKDYPTHVRYDWGEDLDEVLQDQTVCFTQCKRINDVAQPAKLAQILVGFAPKWLWTPSADRDRVSFRLVGCDVTLRNGLGGQNDVRDQFLSLLEQEPSRKSDRFLWQSDALAVGAEQLFDALWSKLSFVYVDSGIDADDPAGVVLSGEAAALNLLVRRGFVNAATQKAALDHLRCLINENLIKFDPKNEACPSVELRKPVSIDATDVRLALVDQKDQHPPPFTVVDRVVLTKARSQPKEKFLFESPEWRHVVHGPDKEVKFIERHQTEALRDRVRQSLIKPLLAGTSNLPVLFVIGPPGAGKSTLVRRVAATLIESGEIVVADAGLNLADGPLDRQVYAEYLQDLTNVGRPVLLVLDDPLFEDSGWIDLLLHLKQPGFHLGVISASPDFLYQQHRSELTKLSCNEWLMDPPTPAEKAQIAKIFDRDVKTFSDDSDDFLVMIAEAESGEEFPKIMRRLWQSLNDGRAFDPEISFHDLPWQVRAFWFVCFLHRFYNFCPLLILKAALKLSGGTGGTMDVETALSKLRAQSGWSIFRHHKPRNSRTSEDDFISTAHQTIASTAWQQRPMKWFDSHVHKILAQSSIEEPQLIRSIAIIAGILAKGSNVDFARTLVEAWKAASAEPQGLETRHIYTFVFTLMHSGRELIAPLKELMKVRAIGKDGWLMALQFLLSEDINSSAFPADIDLASLIVIADFSIAPIRATQLFQRLGSRPELMNKIYERLFESLEGRLDWDVEPTLLSWMLSNAPGGETTKRLPHILSWLERHDDDSSVRTQYLTLLQSLPLVSDEQRKQALSATRDWLTRHDENSEVRTKYLAFLQALPPTFDEQRKQAVSDTQDWFKRHDENSHVRTRYLAFLQVLPPAFDEQRKQAVIDTQDWLKRYDENSYVRTQYLSFVQGLPSVSDKHRAQAVSDTQDWLKRHDENSDVRTKYLAFLQVLPPAFDEQRKQAIIDTQDWLKRHDENSDVRTRYLAFLQVLPPAFDEQRKQAVSDTQDWLKRHDKDSDVRTQYLSFLQALSSEFDKYRVVAAYDTAAWLERHVSETVLVSYLAFLSDLPLADLQPLREASDKYHQDLITRYPTKFQYNFAYGEQLIRLSRFNEALLQYETVLDRHKGHQMARRGRAFALLKLGRIEEAEIEFKSALWWAKRNQQSQAVFHTSLGEFYLETKHWQKAINSFKNAQREFPHHYRNHWGIGKAQLGLGDLKEAAHALKLALEDKDLKSPAKEEVTILHAQISELLNPGTD